MMRRLLLAVVALVLSAGCAWAARDRASLAILAETRVRRVALMPVATPPPPGVEEEELPSESELIAGGKPLHLLGVRLWSPGIAPSNARASLALPPGLRLGERLDLDIYRPKPGQTVPEVEAPAAVPNYTLKVYWGSSATVRPRQPRVMRLSDLTGEQQAALLRLLAEVALGPPGPRFYRPGWTTASWPALGPPGHLPEGASLAGRYTLTTDYTGGATIRAPRGKRFLPPQALALPDLTKRAALDRALTLRWRRLRKLVGQQAMILGKEGPDTLVIWSAAERAGAAPFREWSDLEAAAVRALVRRDELLKPGRTRAVVPAGIFTNVDLAHLVLIGYGPQLTANRPNLRARLATNTTLLAVLGGKALPGTATHEIESEKEEMERERRP